jgi:hypothetical protein
MDLHLKRVAGRLARLLAPEGVDQVVAGDDLVRAQEQAREQKRLPPRAERDGQAVVDDLEWSENAELRRLLLLRVTPSPA